MGNEDTVNKLKKERPESTLVDDCFISALGTLVKTKSINEITVAELCRTAGVSRMSFYRKYDSIDDIIEKRLDRMFARISTGNDSKLIYGSKIRRDRLERYFDLMYQNRDFIDLLLACRMEGRVLDKHNEYLKNRFKPEQACLRYAFAGSVFNLFRIWSQSGYSCDKEMLVSACIELYR